MASPVPAAYDPDPDYFFHWFRDSAIIIDALRVAQAEGLETQIAVERLREFVDFNQALRKLDGREFIRHGALREKVQPSFLQYVRPDDELAAVFGDAVLAEARVNPDGTLDFTRWARPQNDGPALQVLALTRWRDARPDLDDALQAAMLELVIGDLDFIRTPRNRAFVRHLGGRVRAIIIIRSSRKPRRWFAAPSGLRKKATQNGRATFAPSRTRLLSSLDAYWSAEDGYYRSRTGVVGGVPEKTLDISVILGVLHAGREKGAHSVLDPKAQATLAALEDLFDAEYPVNQDRPADHGPAIGRYAKDAYYGGNPWYLATLAAAEFYFKLAIALRSGAEMPATSDNARFRGRLGAKSPARGRFRTRRYFHANCAGLYAAERGSLGTVRSRNGRADFGQTPRLELRRVHHRRREPPPGRPGHSRLRSLRDFLKPGVTIRFPNWRRSPKAWRISMLA